ncbi:MAG: pyridoxamine 5'-phosphate oxidase [Lentisphaerae bacterium]|nr:pyridoxamine 5'-phosphate oxidase [Lentisphaerota bacterium]
MTRTRLPIAPPTDPITLFRRWFARAQRTDPTYPNAMSLAVVGPGGAPSSRIVLLKDVVDGRFVFYTNYNSRKGRALADNPRVALVFWWREGRRQVRIEGRATPVARAQSEAYFMSRPRGYRLGAWASRQSSVILDRAELARRYREAAARFQGREVTCPPHWGGYAVQPARLEFWTERANRLHDRLEYRRTRGGWSLRRLSP